MHAVRVHVPARRCVFFCGQEEPPEVSRTPALPLSQLQAHVGTHTRPVDFLPSEGVHNWLVRTPPSPAWKTFLDSDHPVLRDDGVLPTTVSSTVGRKLGRNSAHLEDDPTSRDAIRAIQRKMESVTWFGDHEPTRLHVHSDTTRHAGPLTWRPAWARVEGATSWDIGRLTAAVLVLTAARTRSFTVEVPPSALHIQRWLDLLWSLNSLWRDDMPHVIICIRGKISPLLQARLLLLFSDEETGASVPSKTGAWPRILAMALSRLHVQMHPSHQAEDLLSECETLAGVVSTSTLATFSVHAGRADDTSERRNVLFERRRARDVLTS